MKQIVILSLVVLLSLEKCSLVKDEQEGVSKCQQYHKRLIYYSQDENICEGDRQLHRRDVLSLEIQLPNGYFSDVLVTSTSCGMWASAKWDQVLVLPQIVHTWNWQEDGQRNEITFTQNKQVVTHEGKVLGIIVTTSIDPESIAIISGVDHTCVVQGDDSLYHFGYYQDISPPILKVSCSRKFNLMTE